LSTSSVHPFADNVYVSVAVPLVGLLVKEVVCRE
jgi:hypothetical protein